MVADRHCRTEGRTQARGLKSLLAKWAPGLLVVGRRLISLRASPREVGLGCALEGVRLHHTFARGSDAAGDRLRLPTRANVPAAIVGTFVGNP